MNETIENVEKARKYLNVQMDKTGLDESYFTIDINII